MQPSFNMKCRIDFSEFHNGRYSTYVTTPAPDAYTQPSSYRLYSESQLGNSGSEITVTCTIRGFIRNKSYQDKQTGQQKVFHEDNVFFDATLAGQQKQVANQ